MTRIPARPAFLLLVLGALSDLADWIVDPAGAQIRGTPLGLVDRAAGEFLMLGAFYVLVYQVIRQMRLVRRLHASAPNIDLFQPKPLHAFSHLTVRVAIAFLGVAALLALVTPPTEVLSLSILSTVIPLMVIAVAAYFVPLYGLHGRLVAAKDDLLAAANAQLKVTIARLHAAVEADDMARADQLQKTMASLVQERDILMRLRTWPWDPTTLRALASAIALPVGIWVVTRLLGHVVS
jgi:hypothetical protein